MVTATNHYMLAASVPLLKGHRLCDFLANMDAIEQKTLEEESKNYHEQFDSFRKERDFQSKASKTSAAVGTLAIGEGLRQSKNIDSSVGSFLLYGSGLIITMVGLAILASHIEEEKSFSNKEISNINSDRILRLQDKVREIEKRMKEELQSPEKEQLPRAKDYFEWKKIELVSIQTNQIEVKVRSV
ncbi:MAG TPA: hypothetical protein VLE96_03885 [Chlamydiales bacterium]|nr:hypothetical protein [Chlamydiales bacterium]